MLPDRGGRIRRRWAIAGYHRTAFAPAHALLASLAGQARPRSVPAAWAQLTATTHASDLVLPGHGARPASMGQRAVPDLEPRACCRSPATVRLGHSPERQVLPPFSGLGQSLLSR